MFVLWQKQAPSKQIAKSGYKKETKSKFKKQMAGEIPLPSMPVGVTKPEEPFTATETAMGKRKRQKNLLALIV